MRTAIVLDTSAVQRFVLAEDVAVGELLGEVADDQLMAAIPVTALAAARAAVSNPAHLAMLDLLVGAHRNVVVLPMRAGDGLAIGECAAQLGADLGLAHAVIEARLALAQLVTERGADVRAVYGDMYGVVDI